MMNKFIQNVTKLLIYSVVFFGFLGVFGQQAQANPMAGARIVNLALNGQVLPAFDTPSFILGGRTFVPVRYVFEAMDATVDFQPEQQRITIAHNQSTIIMHVGDYQFRHDNAMHTMDVAPQIINNRTMVPVSFVAEAIGFDVDWNNETSTVYLTYNGNDEETAEQPIENPNPEAPQNEQSQGDTHYQDTEIVSTPEEERERPNFAHLSIDNSPNPITMESNSLTNVNSITWNENQNQFTITASGRITDVEWYMHSDGRLRVDILNGRANFAPSTHGIHNQFLSNIRTGQNYIHGHSVARVVFDLTSPVVYRVALSEDRRHVVVTFEPKQINQISFNSTYNQNNSETITISGNVLPKTDIFFLENPRRMVIDLPNARMMTEIYGADGVLVNNLHVGQFDPFTARVVVGLSQNVSFNVYYDYYAATVEITITDPTYRNIYFQEETGTIGLRRPAGFYPNLIQRVDEYLEGRYTFILPSDFSEFFGYGTFMVRRGTLNNVEIVTENGQTHLIFNTDSIRGFVLTYDDNHIFIRHVNPREIHPFVVLLDPGHGGHDPGARHHGMRESDIVLDISLRVAEILRRDGIVQVYMTRDSDVTVANAHRAATANDIADIFVSVHVNAANRVATGTETLYAIHDDEPTDFNSRHLSEIFQTNMVEAFGSVDRGVRNRPRIQVLNSTRIPATLLELEFLDTPLGYQLFSSDSFRDLAANVIVQSIYEAMDTWTPPRP
ncbi:MAG: N-acetylmuramoyl-L-alanine amidase family protein [Defluviitaleaceae bacterium]|nr:N-acetylmuramoyl-L-alanine amidase family protein [Defluviitaleaceae bacterium]